MEEMQKSKKSSSWIFLYENIVVTLHRKSKGRLSLP